MFSEKIFRKVNKIFMDKVDPSICLAARFREQLRAWALVLGGWMVGLRGLQWRIRTADPVIQ